ncbi:MAG: hypothetical protein ABJE47_23740, partial [bacterium]
MITPTVVVFVPGILGTQLTLDGEVVWPGTVLEYVRGYDRMDQLLDNRTVAGDIIRSFGPMKQYVTLVDDLARCGYSEVVSPRTLYVLGYDWRKDNSMSASLLADQLDEVVRIHGAAVNIGVVAHSMGGLVARYYLESGEYAERPAFARVCQLITLGTPHRGAALALAAARGDIPRLFLSKEQVKALANHTDYPSLYQLLPPQDEPFLWDEAVAAGLEPVDVYAPAMAHQLGLSLENLASAQRFRSGLSLERRPSHVRYFSFYGTAQKTITSMRLTSAGGGPQVRPFDAENGGDETVPVWSAGLNGVQGLPVGGEHGTIFRDDALRLTLASLLGKKGVLAGEPQRTTVLVPKHVVAPEERMTIQLAFATPTAVLQGSIAFRRVTIQDDDAVGIAAPFGKPSAIQYSGSHLNRLEFTVTAPEFAGFYEAVYTSALDGD